MTALTADRTTPRRELAVMEKGVAAATTIYAGSLVCLTTAGTLTPGAAGVDLLAIGRAEEYVDNSAGIAGALNCRVLMGTFRWANSSSGDAIDIGDVGEVCFIVDDQTVAKTDNAGARSPAGVVVDVDAQGVWVNTGLVNPSENRLKLGVPTITVGAEGGNSINVAIQLTDNSGEALARRASIMAYLSDDANGDSVAGTAPDGNVAIGADGVLIPVVADKAFQLVSEVDGEIDLDIGESSVDTWYLILVMPDGRLVASDAITFA